MVAEITKLPCVNKFNEPSKNQLLAQRERLIEDAKVLSHLCKTLMRDMEAIHELAAPKRLLIIQDPVMAKIIRITAPYVMDAKAAKEVYEQMAAERGIEVKKEEQSNGTETASP